MKKLLKPLLAVAAAVVVLVAAAAVALRLLLPPDKLKALAIEQADKTLHRKLEINAVGLGLFSGLRIEGLRLSESPDFSKGEFLKADRLVVSPEWLPLLHKQLVARVVALEGASLTAVKGKDGKFNFSDLSGASAPAPAGKSAAPTMPSSGPALAVNVLRLRSVALHYIDRQKGTKADLNVDAVEADGFKPSGPFEVSCELNADYAAAGRRYSAKLTANGKADLGAGDPSKFLLDLPKIGLSTLGKTLAASLKVEGAGPAAVSLDAAVPPLDDKFLREATGAAVPAGLILPELKASARLSYADPRLDIKSLKLAAAGAEIAGSGGVADLNAKSPRVQLKINSNQIPLSSLAQAAESMKQFGLTGTVKVDATASGEAAAPKAAGTVVLEGVGAKIQGQTLEKTAGEMRFTQDSVDIPQLTGRLNGGDFRLKVSAGNPAAPYANLSGRLSLLDLGALQNVAPAPAPGGAGAQAPAPTSSAAAKAGPPLKTSGEIVVDKTVHPNFECGKAQLSWNFTGVAPGMSRLNGTARLNVGPGKATDLMQLAASRGGLVKALVVPLVALQKAKALGVAGLNIPDLDHLPFNKIAGSYTAVNGVVTMAPFQFDSPSLGITTTGTVDLAAQTANLKAVTSGPIGEWEFDITGPLANPSVRPNLAKAAQSVGKKLLQQQLQQQGEKLLKGLFH